MDFPSVILNSFPLGVLFQECADAEQRTNNRFLLVALVQPLATIRGLSVGGDSAAKSYAVLLHGQTVVQVVDADVEIPIGLAQVFCEEFAWAEQAFTAAQLAATTRLFSRIAAVAGPDALLYALEVEVGGSGPVGVVMALVAIGANEVAARQAQIEAAALAAGQTQSQAEATAEGAVGIRGGS